MSSSPSLASTACESPSEPAKGSDLEKSPQKHETPTKGSNVVDWDGADDPENPQNWSIRRKWGCTTVVSLFTFMASRHLEDRQSSLPMWKSESNGSSSAPSSHLYSLLLHRPSSLPAPISLRCTLASKSASSSNYAHPSFVGIAALVCRCSLTIMSNSTGICVGPAQ